MAYSPDGKTLASGSGDDTIRLWDVETGEEKLTLTAHRSLGLFGGVFTRWQDPGQWQQYAWDGEAKITLRLGPFACGTSWTGEEKRTLTGHTHDVSSVAYSPDGKTLASGSGDDTIRLWDVGTGEEKRTLTGHTHDVSSVAYSPDGKTLARPVAVVG